MTTVYTPLEKLLFFQALRSEGVNTHAVFNRISDQLKSIPLVKDDASFDSGRLSPDALRELYLWLLKEEVKADLQQRREGSEDGGKQNGDTTPGSRKRKLPSPKLATVHEASQHAHLIPQLVMRLYACYRELAVREIKESEKRYDNATREIGEIEAGKWDERLQRQRTASATQSPRPSSKAHTQPPLNQQTQSSTSRTASPAVQQESVAQQPPKRSSGLDALLNHGPEPQNGISAHRRNSSNTTLPPLSEMAPQSPRFGIPPKMPTHTSQQMQHGQAYNQSPTYAHQSPYPPQNGMNSPQVQQPLSRPTSSSSGKPFLPPPHGMTLPPPTPPQYHSPSLRGPQPPSHQPRYSQPPQHRLSTSYSPTNERAPMGYPAPGQAQPPPAYYQPQQPYDRRVSYPVQAHQQQPPPYGYPSHPPPPGGYQLQPFTVDPQDPAHGQVNQVSIQQQQARLPPQTPTHPQRPPVQYAQYPPQAATVPRLPSETSYLLPDILSRLGTPPPKSKQRPLFRNTKRLSHLAPDREIPSPVQDIEPLSPVHKRADLAAPSARSTRTQDAETVDAEPQRAMRGRGRPKRDRSPHSVVSSTADESARMTRSHSVSTATGAVPTSDDRPASRGNVKLEPSTPAGFVDDNEAAPDAQSGPMTRKRRGTLQSLAQPSSKRRRHGSVSAASEDRHAASPGPPAPRQTTITATRNFHKTTQPIMDGISRHKHGGYFATAVRDKDAPGYSDIVNLPQNLKAIRAAITAGSKAVANAATSTSPSASGGADGTVELDRSTELMPPNAIVNAAQLEREVMRMFANAIMFNPGEDGLVSDTREMAEDVEGLIRQWRGFETEEGGVAGEEEVGGREEDEGRGMKRRKG